MVWNDTVSSGRFWASKVFLKKAERRMFLLCGEWLVDEFIWVLLVAYTFCHMKIMILVLISIYIHSTTKLLTTTMESFVTLKVLIQNKRIRQFTAQTLHSAFAQDIVRIGYSPSLLLLWTLVRMHDFVSFCTILNTVAFMVLSSEHCNQFNSTSPSWCHVDNIIVIIHA